jgi:hypothetical protein
LISSRQAAPKASRSFSRKRVSTIAAGFRMVRWKPHRRGTTFPSLVERDRPCAFFASSHSTARPSGAGRDLKLWRPLPPLGVPRHQRLRRRPRFATSREGREGAQPCTGQQSFAASRLATIQRKILYLSPASRLFRAWGDRRIRVPRACFVPCPIPFRHSWRSGRSGFRS